ncbi:MAG TPA: hypothetical protein VGS57_13770 [Thermoanaerobaculia bacterium]|nr:hypothetical protein [Thermoanaerobaculia bacterium]
MITVLLGGIFGTLITTTVQQAISTRERIRADHKALVQARLATVHEAFSLLGRMIGTAEDLMVSTGPEYSLDRFTDPQERKETVDQVHAIHRDYNTVDRRWRSARYSYALLLAYYHPGRLAVSERWAALTDAAGEYVSCARSWAVANAKHGAYDGSCDDRRRAVDASILQFSEAIVEGDGSAPVPGPTAAGPD